jgi:D-alanyl-D-alanine carboxypeptidase
MHVRHRSRSVAGTGVLAALLAVGVGAVVAPGAASAPVAASGPVAGSRGAGGSGSTAVAPPALTAPAGPAAGDPVLDPPYPHSAAATARAVAPMAAPVVAGARVAAAVRAATRPATRLSLTVRPRAGSLALTAVLARAASGARLGRRTLAVWTRTGDTGRWRLTRHLRTDGRGVAVAQLADAPLLQVTLRFAGDSTHAPAASVLIVPRPGPATALDPRLVAALATARTAARRAGLSLVLNSGFRSWAKQQSMYDAAVRRYGSARVARRWVLPPQESTHVRGLAADLGTPAAAAWLTVHGARYGLCRAYGNEPWHFEYRPDWVAAYGGRCPAVVPVPGDPAPLSPLPHVAVIF